MNAAEVTAFGTVLSIVLGIFWRITHSQTKLTGKVIEVVEKNAQASERNAQASEKVAAALNGLQENVKANTEVTKENVVVLREHKDAFSDALADVIRNGKRRRR